jgi:capsular exopolysaccharide synthesis family protein
MQYEGSGGAMSPLSIKIIHEKGMLQRLLSQGWIYPDGKLTPKGIRLCSVLRSRLSTRAATKAAADSDPPKPLGEPRAEACNDGPETVGKRARTPALSPGPERAPLRCEDSLVAYLEDESFEAEQIKIIKTSILFPLNGKPSKSILVTSIEPGDGKSFVAANLAVSMAKNVNTHVLLIDCDLRKPTLHAIFGLRSAPGLSQYLAEGRRLPWLLQKTALERLSVLTAGGRPKSPAELLSSPRMTFLVRETARRYPNRIVILDSPPSPLTAESAVLARSVDGILMVVKHGKTHLKDLQHTVEKLGRDKFLGSVLNGYKCSLREYYGYRKYPGYAGSRSAEAASARAGDSGRP